MCECDYVSYYFSSHLNSTTLKDKPMRDFISIITFLVLAYSMEGQDWMRIPDQPQELGHVRWVRSYDDALAQAKLEEKPVLILFQEVPGCATCRNYGNDLLRHPLIVEAIETYYVPLAIYNNKGGADADVLRRFHEPAWNNPVCRIIDPSSEKDIVQRLNGRYDLTALVSYINQGLLASNVLIPAYLHNLEREVSVNDVRETHLSMYCFWSGEKALGNLDGVVATKAGFMNGSEVVKVRYDAGRVSEEDLLRYASKQNCADAVYTDDQREVKAAKSVKVASAAKGKFRPDREPKYYLSKTDLRFVPMTDLQALKINRALAQRQTVESLMSSRQLEILDLVRSKKLKSKNVVDLPLIESWISLLKENS